MLSSESGGKILIVGERPTVNGEAGSVSSEPIDAEVRLSALSPHQSFHVESPAGAGKTSLLTARFIRLLAEVEHPHQILALTFTNKAASEMRERISAVLNQVESGPAAFPSWMQPILPYASKALKRHAGHLDLLKSPEGLRIMTFHSFCLFLARQSPFEAGISIEAAVLGEGDQTALLIETARKMHDELFSRPPSDEIRKALERRLLHLNNDWAMLEQELIELVRKRDLLGDVIAEIRQGREHLAQILTNRLTTFTGAYLLRLKKEFTRTGLGRNWGSLHRFLCDEGAPISASIPPELPGAEYSELSGWRAVSRFCLTKSGNVRQRLTPAGGFPKGFQKSYWADCIKSLPPGIAGLLYQTEELPEPSYSPSELEPLFDLIMLAGQAIEIYGSLCRNGGWLDYAELELAALRVLGDEENPTDLQFILDQRIHHILIDEFQDTSWNQWQILLRLCSGWSRDDGRTVFIVGDPKQSIYGFRKAEVALFMQAKNGLPIPGQDYLSLVSLNLLTNFRSDPQLVDFTNRLFGGLIMSDPDLEVEEVPYVEAHPVPQRTCGGQVSLAVFSDGDKAVSRQREAAWLAMQVQQAVRRNPGASIGILVPARNCLPVYLNALQQSGLQVKLQEGILLTERSEVMDLYSLTRALVRPHDDLAWAALLRSPWCWADLNLLQKIAEQNASGWMEKIRNYRGPEKTASQPAVLWKAIELNLPQVGRMPLSRVVGRIWEELKGPEAVCSVFGPGGVENCRRFLQILDESEAGIPEDTLYRLELAIKKAYAPSDPLAMYSPVHFMTVHHAKGLEFDVVFLPFMDWDPLGKRETPPYIIEKLPGIGGRRLIALKPDRRLAEDSKIFNLLRKISARKKLGEAKRLFYVAATRARKELHMSGIALKRKDKISLPAHSFLSYLFPDRSCADVCRVENPQVELIERTGRSPAPQNLPEPFPVAPEKLPFKIVSPSSLHGEPQRKKESGPSQADDGFLAARGTVIHGLFERLSTGGSLPSVEAVSAALCMNGVDENSAPVMAAELLSEVTACLNEEFCSFVMRSDHIYAQSELALEDFAGEGTVRRGIIDRVVHDGKTWYVVDYKSTPVPLGQNIADFLEIEAGRYRNQLLAYSDMLANAMDIKAEQIRAFLYFTALQRAYEVNRKTMEGFKKVTS